MITTDLEQLAMAQHEKCCSVEYYMNRAEMLGPDTRIFYEGLAMENAIAAEALGRIYDICAKL